MNNIYKDIKLAVKVALVIAAVLLIIHIFLGDEMGWSRLGILVINSLFYGIPLSLFNGWLFDYLGVIYPWDKYPRKRAFIGIGASILLTLATLVVFNFIMHGLILGEKLDANWISGNRMFYLVALIITVIVSITFHAITFFREVQTERVINARLNQEKLFMELTALRDQVDPHFLFNSFNVLSGLIDENPTKAQKFLSELSGIYRYVLEQKEDDSSTVGDELAFAKKYLALQKMRFENSINLHTNVSEETTMKKIPSLSLQLLLENAVKHNAFDEDDPLNIYISSEKGHLEIRNNFRPRNNFTSRKGIGLKNIAERYQLLTGEDIEVDHDENYFTVKIPLI